MKSDVLVIGSTQFVGSNICNYMLQHTRLSVAGTDDLVQGQIENLQPSLVSRSRFNFYPLNLSDHRIVGKLLQLVAPTYLIVDLTNYCKLDDAIHLLSSASANKVSKAILILPSDVEYRADDSLMQEQNHNKIVTDLLTTNLSGTLGDMSIISVVPCELYGPRQELTGNFAALATSALSTGLADPADIKVHWLYIKDLFHNILSFMDPKFDRAGIIKLNTNKECSYKNLYHFMRSVVGGQRISLEAVSSMIKTDENNMEAISHFDLESSIEHTLCWYADNKWAWR